MARAPSKPTVARAPDDRDGPANRRDPVIRAFGLFCSFLGVFFLPVGGYCTFSVAMSSRPPGEKILLAGAVVGLTLCLVFVLLFFSRVADALRSLGSAVDGLSAGIALDAAPPPKKKSTEEPRS